MKFECDGVQSANTWFRYCTLKIFSPLVKKLRSLFSSSYIDLIWVCACNALERGMEGFYSEFHYKGLGFKKGRR